MHSTSLISATDERRPRYTRINIKLTFFLFITSSRFSKDVFNEREKKSDNILYQLTIGELEDTLRNGSEFRTEVWLRG